MPKYSSQIYNRLWGSISNATSDATSVQYLKWITMNHLQMQRKMQCKMQRKMFLLHMYV